VSVFLPRGFEVYKPGVRVTKDVYGVDVGRGQESTKECSELGMLQKETRRRKGR
jgi:hypothetical protein